MGRESKTTWVEALKWLEQGNEIHFSDDPLVADSKLLVEGLYEEGAEKVEIALYPEDTKSRILIITLSTDYNTMLETMFEVGILTPSGPIVKCRAGENTVSIIWRGDRERFPDVEHIGIHIADRFPYEEGESIYNIERVLLPKLAETYRDGIVIDFGGTLDSSVVELLKEKGALVDPIADDPDEPKRAVGMDIVLPESYDKALECMIIIALLGLDVGSTLVVEKGQCTRVSAYAPDDLLA